jgi:hypothetical protein
MESALILIGVFVLWFVLVRWALPAMGVGT